MPVLDCLCPPLAAYLKKKAAKKAAKLAAEKAAAKKAAAEKKAAEEAAEEAIAAEEWRLWHEKRAKKLADEEEARERYKRRMTCTCPNCVEFRKDVERRLDAEAAAEREEIEDTLEMVAKIRGPQRYVLGGNIPETPPTGDADHRNYY